MSDGPRTMTKKVTITSGQTVSTAADCQGYTLVALSIPSSFTGTAVTFQGSIDGTAGFQQLVSSTAGAAITWTPGAADKIIMPVGGDPIISGVVQLKVVSNAGGGEAATRTIILHFLRTNE